MKRAATTVWAVLLILLAGTAGSRAQSPEPAASLAPVTGAPAPPLRRPKIGLALSGGGARGVAHIGVLKALEQMHIPIDYIAGTSMGSIVGGLYAAGASTDDLEKLVATTDWSQIFSDRPVRSVLPFRQKEDDRKYIEGLSLGLDSKGLHVTKGLVNGQKFMFLLENSTRRAAGIRDFDALPIPFRCVATDISTGGRYIFSHGSLPVAIRASMSLPAIFTPVEVDGHLLVDGGIADNLPVDVVRAMGADVIIAVDIGTPPLDREQINSPVAVFSQVVSLLMQKEVDVQASQATILLRPRLGRFSMMDFPHSLKVVPLGEEAVRDKSAALSRYAVSPEEYAAWQARVRGLPPPPVLDFVEFSGTAPQLEARIRAAMRGQPGQPLTLDGLQRDLAFAYNTGDYASVTYELAARGAQEGAVVTAKPSSMGPNTMRFGIELSSDFTYNSNWAILAGLRFAQLNRLGAEWKSDLELGLNQRLYTEWYQPVDPGARFFVVPYLTYTNELDYVFVNAKMNEPSASYRTGEGWAGMDLGVNIGRSGQLRLGPRWGHASFTRAVGLDIFPSFYASLGEFQATYTYDRLDSADLPTRGIYLTLTGVDSTRALGATDSYKQGEFKLHAYQRLSERSGIFEWLAAGTAFGTDVPYYDWFRIGGPYSFAGYMQGELAGPYYASTRLGYQYKFASLPAIIGTGAYVMAYADIGKPWIQTLDTPSLTHNLKHSGTIAFGSSTKFGPVLFGYSYASGRNQMLFLSVGKRW